MKLPVILLAVAALVAVLVVGLVQSQSGNSSSGPPKALHLSAAQTRQALAGSPPPLARVHAQANQLLPGGLTAFKARLRALRGHPVVVNVWAAWCAPCRYELPVFQHQALEHGARIAFLGIDTRDNAGDAHDLLREVPLTYPSYTDRDERIARSFSLFGTPSTIFYDARGRHVTTHTGPYDSVQDLETAIRRYALQ
jgi:thiol-disulfide isomerase/thioredoxin